MLSSTASEAQRKTALALLRRLLERPTGVDRAAQTTVNLKEELENLENELEEERKAREALQVQVDFLNQELERKQQILQDALREAAEDRNKLKSLEVEQETAKRHEEERKRLIADLQRKWDDTRKRADEATGKLAVRERELS